MRAYFNRIYNPLYDLTTARTGAYRRFQDRCLKELELSPGDKVLCIGVGTGNEILHIKASCTGLHLYGIDTSTNGLLRARSRARLEHAARMDAHRLAFGNASFDKIFCHHVMGFLQDDRKATVEAMRVLKPGGQFVITYPAAAGGLTMITEVLSSIKGYLRGWRPIRAITELLSVMGALLLNIPIAFWVRPREGFYTIERINSLYSGVAHISGTYKDAAYQDYAVSGRRRKGD